MTAKVTSCRRCGGDVRTVGDLSARKLCRPCGTAAVWANAVQLVERNGPYFEVWRRKTILALLDLDTSPSRSLDLISDAQLVALLSGDGADALR